MKDGPGGSEALWVVDVKNGKGSVTNDAGVFGFFVTSLCIAVLSENAFYIKKNLHGESILLQISIKTNFKCLGSGRFIYLFSKDGLN